MRAKEFITKLKNAKKPQTRSKEFDESINESLDQPYKILQWEKGDFGDVDAIARLDDGTFLSIMFTKGFSQETKEEAWSVEFYRNNSQEVTGEGDQQRVFATVLSAVQTFISDRVPGAKGKYKPNKIYFSASKEVKPDEDQRKAMTRARLYDSLVQRYARALGFRAFRAETGNKVMYELSRIKPVAENLEEGVNDNYLYHATMPAGLMRIAVQGKKLKEAGAALDITFTPEPYEGWNGMGLMITAYSAGDEIGHVIFEPTDNDKHKWYATEVEVEDEYQRKGIATAMYDMAKKISKKSKAVIVPSHAQTSDAKGLWKNKKVWEASGYIPSNAQKNDPRFKTALTKEVKPDSIQKNAKAFGFKTSRAGIPPLLRK